MSQKARRFSVEKIVVFFGRMIYVEQGVGHFFGTAAAKSLLLVLTNCHSVYITVYVFTAYARFMLVQLTALMGFIFPGVLVLFSILVYWRS